MSSRSAASMQWLLLLLLLLTLLHPQLQRTEAGAACTCTTKGQGPPVGAPKGNNNSCGGCAAASGSPDGWCDDACYTYNDCCSDYAKICKIPNIAGISPPNGPTGGGIPITINGGSFSSNGSFAFYQPSSGFSYQWNFKCNKPVNSAGGTTGQYQQSYFTDCTYTKVSAGQVPTTNGVTTPANTGVNNQNATVSQLIAWSDNQIVLWLPNFVGTGWKINVTNSFYNTSSGVNNDSPKVAYSAFNANNPTPYCIPTFNYDAPAIASSLPIATSGNVPSQGGVTVTLVGSSFGPTNPAGNLPDTLVYYGLSSINVTTGTVIAGATPWATNPAILNDFVSSSTSSQMAITLPAGTNPSVNNPFLVVVGGQLSNIFFLTYSPPTITASSLPAVVTVGQTVTLTGSSFGATGGSLTIGVTAATITQSHTQLVVTIPPGQGTSQVVIYSQGGFTSNQLTTAYAAPTISSAAPLSGATQGGYMITIAGSNFGPSNQAANLIPGPVTIGGNPCAPIDYTNSNANRIICTVPQGEGAAQDIAVYVGGQQAVLSGSFNYNVPFITALSPANGPTPGSALTITGTNFGYLGDVSVTVGGQPCYPATLNLTTYTTIVCTVAAGQGTQLPVIVTVANQASTSNVNYTYDPPVINSLTPALSSTVGGVLLTVAGSNFGTSGVGSVTVGGNTCPTVSWSHTSIVCTLPAGTGTNQPVIVSTPVGTNAASQSSPSFSFNYMAPSISSISPLNGPTAGGTPITVLGSNFGSPLGGSNPGVVSMKQSSSGTVISPLAVQFWSDGNSNNGRIVVQLPVADGAGWQLQVTVSGQLSGYATSYNIGYDAPSITATYPTVGPTRGGVSITLTGSSFDVNGTLSIGGVSVPRVSVQSWGHSKINFLLPAGQGVNLPVKITTLIGYNSNASAAAQLSYQAPSITSISPATAPTANGGLITLIGQNFGTSGQQNVSIGGKQCTSPTWSAVTGSTDQVICTIPSGQGTGLPVTLLTGTQTSNAQYFSYSSPVLSTVSPPNGPTAGAVSITLSGSSFGTTGGAVTVGGKNCSISSQTDSTVICTLPAGAGSNQAVLYTVTTNSVTQYSSLGLFSYYPPTVTSFAPVTGYNTAGGASVTITGTNFGPSSPTVVIGSSACTPSFSNDTTIVCAVPAGQGTQLDIVVTASGQTAQLSSTSTTLFTYGAPTIQTLTSSSNATAGGQLLTIGGFNFGSSGATVTVGGQTCTTQPPQSSAQIFCQLPAYSGANLPVVVTVSQLSSASTTTSSTPTFTYAAPTLTTIAPQLGNTAGGSAVTLTGSNFGPASSAGTVLIGGLSCVLASGGWNDTVITCLLPQGQGVSQPVVVTQLAPNGLNSSVTNSNLLYSYSAPILNGISPSSGITGGNVLVTLTGSNFGSTGQVTIGGQVCVDTYHVSSTIVCNLPAGQGLNQVVSVTVASQTSTSPAPVLFNYSAPQVSQVTTSGSKATHGGFIVTISGVSFGAAQGNGSVSLPGGLCNVTQWTQTLITCLAPLGEGTAQGVVVTASSGLTSNQSPALSVDYDAPSVSSISPASGASGVVTAGGVLTVSGANFGSDGSVLINNVNATVIGRTSDNSLLVQVPQGQGVNLPVTVIVAGRVSNSALFSYAPPVITALTPANGPTLGNTSITLLGTSFGQIAASAVVAVGGKACAITFNNDTVVVCTTPLGQGTGVSVRLTVGGTQPSNLASFNYDAPVVSSVSPAVGPTDGRTLLTISGSNFGTGSGYASVAGTICPTVSLNQTTIICTLPAGEDVSKQITVSVGSQSSAPYTGFSYAAPAIWSITPTNGTTQGPTSLTVYGTNFGSDAFLTVGSSSCPVTYRSGVPTPINTTAMLICSVPAGQGSNLSVVTTVASQVSAPSTFPNVFSYQPPFISGLAGYTFPTSGGVTGSPLTITGSNFGLTGTVTVDGKICSPVTGQWSHTQVECLVPAGDGLLNTVVITVGQQLSNSYSVRMYGAPTISSITPPDGPTSGSTITATQLNIAGSNFGLGNSSNPTASYYVTVGGALCPIAVWRATLIQCALPAGVGTGVPVVVVANGQNTSSTFQYDAPTLTAISPTHGLTQGTNVVTITGNNFAASDSLITITIGSTVCPVVAGSSTHTSVKCTVPAGVGVNQPVSVSVGNSSTQIQNSVTTLSYSYDGPTITSVHGCGTETSNGTVECSVGGGQTITLTGTSFSSAAVLGRSSLPAITVNGQPCTNVTYVTADTQLSCSTPVSKGFNLPVTVTVVSLSTTANLLSYAGPELNASSATLTPATGGGSSSTGNLTASTIQGGQQTLTLKGKNFGASASAVSVYIGTAAQPQLYSCAVSASPFSDTQLQCAVPAGVGSNLQFTVTVNNSDARVGLLTSQQSVDTLSYPAPIIVANSIRSPNGTAGSSMQGLSNQGDYVIFNATNLGTNAALVTVSYYIYNSTTSAIVPSSVLPCTTVSFLSGNTQLQCRTSPGQGGPYVFQVKVLNTLSNIGTDTYSYPTPPSIYQVSGCNDTAGSVVNSTVYCPTAGGTLLTITGSKFTSTPGEMSVRIGAADCTQVTSISIAPDKLTCVLPAGAGVSQGVVVTVGSLSSATALLLSYNSPTLTAITGCAINNADGSTSGCPRNSSTSLTLTLTGDSFGTSGAIVIIGGMQAASVVHDGTWPQKKVTLTLPSGYGLGRSVLLIQAGGVQSVNQLALSYTPCPAGTREDPNSLQCLTCAAGSYTAAAGLYACVAPPPGSYVALAGQTSYLTCTPGTIAMANATGCVQCGAGSYTGASGQVSCTPCAASTFSTAVGATQCQPCGFGTYNALTGQTACTSCSAGTYVSGSGALQCTSCAAGQYQPQTGQASCLPCAAGYYQPSSGQTSCVPVPAGSYQALSGQASYEGCTSGTYATGTNNSQCTACSPGTFSTAVSASAGAATCTACAVGSYADQSGLPTCFSCPPGTFSNQTGLSSCFPAAAGQYVASSGATAPTAVPAGYYTSAVNSTAALACPQGYYTANASQSSCIACAAGTYQSASAQTSCVACGTGSATSAAGQPSCQQCAPGSYAANSGQQLCTPCPVGNYSSALGSTACPACPSGTYTSLTGQSNCQSCGSGTVSSGSGGQCAACPAGSYSSSSTTCTNCTAGYYAAAGSAACLPCQPGYYSSGSGSAQCSLAMAGQYNDQQAATAPKACSAGTFAASTGSSTCVSCGVGSYANATGSASCTPCPTGTAQSSAGAGACAACAPGTFTSATGQALCSQCPAGSVTATSGLSACSACAVGSSAGSSGLSFCTSCTAGTYASLQGALACTQAPQGYYVPSAGQSAYTPCPTGTYSASTGQSSCSNCTSGQYSSGSAAAQCTGCPAGYANAQQGQGSCQICVAGTYSAAGATACSNCAPGQYSANNGQAVCNACPAGTNSSTGGTAACSACPQGYYQSSAGATSCLQCADGQYNSLQGAAQCSLCPTGTMSTAALGTVTCTPCPTGSATHSQGSAQCSVCAAGTYADSVGQDSCKPCAAGGYAPSTNMSACLQVPAGTMSSSDFTSYVNCQPGNYSATAGAPVCQPCPLGTYNDGSQPAVQCTPCPAGSISNTPGSAACTACPAGSATSTTGQSQCQSCGAGTFWNSSAPISRCDPVPAGSYQDQTGQSSFKSCQPGHYSDKTGLTECLACPAGQNVSGLAATQCSDCPAGFYAPSSGLAQCQPCPIGSYAQGNGSISCTACDPGYFNNDASGVTACQKVPAGSYQSAPGASVAVACPAGSYTPYAGLPQCQLCAAGQYQNVTGATSCISCGPGNYTSGTGHTKCQQCAAGSFAANQGALSCQACAAGTYAPGIGTVACASCPTGHYNALTGQSSCAVCAQGTFNSDVGQAACVDCPAGQYGPSSALSSCTSCLPGTFSAEQATACTQCSAGMYASSAGSSQCQPCPTGNFSAAPGASICQGCAVGTYVLQQSQGQSSCTSCSPGYYQPSVGSSTCLTCSAGSYSDASQEASCTLCAPGTMQSGSGFTQCTACAAGSYQSASGQPQCAVCAPGSYQPFTGQASCTPCAAGESQPSTGQRQCNNCTAGTYQFAQGQSICQPAPLGFFTNATAATNATACQPGTFQNQTGQTSCQLCPIGTYTAQSQQISCAACPAGTYTNVTGQSQCSPCPQGSYTSLTGQVQCLPCSAGSAAATTGSTACVPCAGGTATAASGAVTCAPCGLGSYQPNAGTTNCVDAPAGTYVNLPGQLSTSACAPGSFTNVSHSTNCTAVPAGFYQPAANSTGYIACPTGTYTSVTGQVQCAACPPGAFSNVTGQSTCTLCSPGSSQPLSNQTQCVACPSTTYTNSFGSTSCTPCPPGSASNSSGVASCSSCAPGFNQSTAGAATCTQCPIGTYSPVNATASITCLMCGAGSYSNVSGSSNCTACPAGTYSSTIGNTQCLSCPAGSYTTSSGAQICTLAPAGSYLPVAGLSTPVPCPAGTFANTTGLSVCYDCAVGSYQPGTGQSACLPAPTGSFVNVTASTSYTACSAGTFQSNYSATQCNQCPQGQYNNATAATACTLCVAGTVTNMTGSQQCADCTPGNYQSVPGQSVCQQCPAGTYSNFTALSSTCPSCTPGSYTDVTGLTACLLVPAGSYQSAANAVNYTACGAGTYTSVAGATICTQAEQGHYVNVTGANATTPCPVGTAQSVSGQISCALCPAGSFAATTGLAACSACAPGTFTANAGNEQCTSCPAGSYSANASATNCTLTQPGYFTALVGQSSPSPCQPGHYSNSANTTACPTCPAGSYQAGEGATACVACPRGTYSNATGPTTECVAAAAGFFVNATGATAATQCPIGFFTATSGQWNCSACAPGSYNDQAGQSSCPSCQPGTFSDATTDDTCQPCPSGFYQSANNQSSCIACPRGTYAPAVVSGATQGASSCLPCSPGQYNNQTNATSCQAVPAGYYQANNNQSGFSACAPGSYSPVPAGAVGAVSCTSCLPGTYSNGSASTVCATCAAGSNQTHQAATSCQACPAGSYRGPSDRPDQACVSCPVGQYNVLTGQTGCQSCPIGTYQSTPGQQSCIACAAGTYTNQPNQQTCSPCALGTYSTAVGLNTTCTPCPATSYQNVTGQTGCVSCAAGTYNGQQGAKVCQKCDAGEFGNTTAASSCTACPVGSHAQFAGSLACTPCEKGSYNVNQGQTMCAACDAGKYQNSTGATSCPACPAGSHQSTNNQTSCFACQPGSFAPTAGYADCSLCPAGQYNNITAGTSCTPCPIGSFQSSQNSTSCQLCGPGTYAASTGTAVCAPAPVGSYVNVSGATTYSPCPAGTYAPLTGLTQCLPCLVGTYAANGGQSACSLCQPGSYQNATGQQSCAFCGLGTYSSDQQQSQCQLCPVGQYMDAAGAAACNLCQPGTYINQTGSTACSPCPAGSNQTLIGATTCAACPIGTYSVSGRSTCSSCDAGKFSNVTGALACTDCPLGQFQNLPGQVNCNNCSAGQFTDSGGKTSCDPCVAGFYNTLSGQTQCVPCASGTYQVNPGQTSCDACQAGSYNNNQGLSACLLCAAGSYQTANSSTACILCPIGTEQPAQNASTLCDACPAGHYTNQNGTATCAACSPGTAFNGTGLDTTCPLCGIGTYTASYGATVCTPCPPGSYTAQNGTTQCSLCGYGQYQNASGQTSCIDVPAGTHAGVLGQAQPTPCEKGTAVATTKQKACQPCPQGYYAPTTGLQQCLPCSTGSYQPQTSQSSCQLCPAGTFSPPSTGTGASSCQACPVGTYNKYTNQTSCVSVPPGSYADIEGLTLPKLCPAGSSQPQAGQDSCALCDVRTYAASIGQANCTACAPGTYSAQRNLTSCANCQAGSYQSGSGQSTCLACDVGTISPTAGAASCQQCPAGSYISTTNGTECLACAPGTFSSSPGQRECSVCGDGMAQPYFGKTSCVYCAADRSHASLDHTYCVCEVGFFLPNIAAGVPALQCDVCPDHADCTQPGTTAATLTCLSGYWRATNNSYTCYACPIRSQCTGGINATAIGSNFAAESISQGVGCKADRCGVLCSHCCPGFHEQTGGSCTACPTSDTSYISVVFIGIAIVCLILLQIYVILKSGNEMLMQNKLTADDVGDDDEDGADGEKSVGGDSDSEADSEDYETESDVSNSDDSSEEADAAEEAAADSKAPAAAAAADPTMDPSNTSILTIYGPPAAPPDFTYKLKIFLSFLQICTNITSGLQLQWPQTYTNWLIFFDIFNFDFILSSAISADCISSFNYYNKYLMIVLAPMAALCCIAALYLLPKYLECACFRHQSQQARARSKMVFWRLFLYALFLIYPSVSSNVLRLYVCTDIEGQAWLLTDLRVQCYTDQWNNYAFASLSLVILYPIGVPLFFFALLRLNRLNLHEARMKVQLGFLYAGYRAATWWFEIADCIHKLLLTSVLAFFPTNAQLPVGMSICVLYLMLVLVANPYLRPSDDKLALLASTEIFMLLSAGWIFYNLPTNAYSASDDLELSIVLIMVTAGFFLAFVYFAGTVLVKFYQIWRKKWDARQAAKQNASEAESDEEGPKKVATADDNDAAAEHSQPDFVNPEEAEGSPAADGDWQTAEESQSEAHAAH